MFQNMTLRSLLYFYTSDGGSACPASITLHKNPTKLMSTNNATVERVPLKEMELTR